MDLQENIKTVEIGPASDFRQTINDNFDTIKDEWKGIYVGPESQRATANAKLAVGGIWIVTKET